MKVETELKLLVSGISELSEIELLSMILYFGNGEKSAHEISTNLLSAYGSIENLSTNGMSSYTNSSILNNRMTYQLIALSEYKRRFLSKKDFSDTIISSKDRLKSICDNIFSTGFQEELYALHLTKDNKLVLIQKLAQSVGSEVNISIDSLVRELIRKHQHSIILVHNHPSNISQPSINDINFTRRISKELKKYGINLLSHFVYIENNLILIEY